MCIAFAIYLCYRVGSSLYLQDYVMMDIVANVGTILICIDLAVFLWHSRSTPSHKPQRLCHSTGTTRSNFCQSLPKTWALWHYADYHQLDRAHHQRIKVTIKKPPNWEVFYSNLKDYFEPLIPA